ncbi:Oidioi.mRNA.OKI2018_I69.chr1.g1086.t1.cds [Oikopleura dioica]|uniref:Oidioi.mRNA.OKI2018_I69.chr1.g1086.t1.cds n=1 Tax=Oikopleura dioica TaxID=34765 RepID=A0ABN7SQL4_OIKDI|nr:Oidioi.mRNA.OKI2018_I69.chr1.g1086.t1.cds [Oikopleura dioica]
MSEKDEKVNIAISFVTLAAIIAVLGMLVATFWREHGKPKLVEKTIEIFSVSGQNTLQRYFGKGKSWKSFLKTTDAEVHWMGINEAVAGLKEVEKDDLGSARSLGKFIADEGKLLNRVVNNQILPKIPSENHRARIQLQLTTFLIFVRQLFVLCNDLNASPDEKETVKQIIQFSEKLVSSCKLIFKLIEHSPIKTQEEI